MVLTIFKEHVRPDDFNVDTLTTPEMRKVARTLKVYGAMVVDRNIGTPFVIYVQNGANFNVSPDKTGAWNATAVNELHRIRAALRPLVSASKWMKGGIPTKSPTYKGAPINGETQFGPEFGGLNLISMRNIGASYSVVESGNPLYRAIWDSRLQAAVFPRTYTGITQSFTYRDGLMNRISWGKIVPGASYTLRTSRVGLSGVFTRITLTGCVTEEGATAEEVDTGWVGVGETKVITAPLSGACSVKLWISKPTNWMVSVINPASAEFYRTPPSP